MRKKKINKKRKRKKKNGEDIIVMMKMTKTEGEMRVMIEKIRGRESITVRKKKLREEGVTMKQE